LISYKRRSPLLVPDASAFAGLLPGGWPSADGWPPRVPTDLFFAMVSALQWAADADELEVGAGDGPPCAPEPTLLLASREMEASDGLPDRWSEVDCRERRGLALAP